MGFVDFLTDAGLTGKILLQPHLSANFTRQAKLTFDSVLNSWLTTRSYIVGYVVTSLRLSSFTLSFVTVVATACPRQLQLLNETS